MSYDFSGWATRNDILCSDGRTIRKDAFKENDGTIVPLVWNHRHDDPNNVLGHALLENRNEGVYTYCTFNDTKNGQNAKRLVEHGDVTALSIYANKLMQRGGDVLHGQIREVSLVLAGANRGAFIDSVLTHSDNEEEEAIIFTGEDIYLNHADEMNEEAGDESIQDVFDTLSEKQKNAVYAIVGMAVEDAKGGEMSHADEEEDNPDETIQDVFDTLSEKQKKAVYAIVGMAVEQNKGAEGGNNSDMKHNVFENDQMDNNDYISHSEMQAVMEDARRYGSMKDAVLAHGITNIDYMFPDAKTIADKPEFYRNEYSWVKKVMSGVHHTPFARIKSLFANLTADEARAKGFTKGNVKTEEVFSMLKRVTTPTTVYKKQKMDRDDVIDITDFDVVAWIKTEMREMLDEEIARAILVGDGRLSSSDDKINPLNIRPVFGDDQLYVTNVVASSDTPKDFIDACVYGRIGYQGSGKPTLFTGERQLTAMLLMKDTTGRNIYKDEAEIATALRVKEIVTCPFFDNDSEHLEDDDGNFLAGIIVNLADYNVGADKGGAVNMFDDFDIDYNTQKYLIETRCSGALVKPKSAITIMFPAEEEISHM